MAFIDWKKCFSDPKHVLRLTAVIICVCIASYQLSGCVEKILHPPVNTHYGFDLNKTLRFPSVTICRNPAYRTNISSKFNVSINDRPSNTNFWRYFNYKNHTIKELFEEITFDSQEFIRYYGFTGNGNGKNSVKMTSFYSLSLGKCFTFTPMNESYLWSSNTQYVFMLKHSEFPLPKLVLIDLKDEGIEKYIAQTSENPPTGYHVYIHNPHEKIADTQFQDDSFMEYVHIETGEQLKVNLRPHEFNQVSSKDNKCRPGYNYAKSQCTEDCMHQQITKELRCQSPWMPNSKYPLCNSFDQVKEMIQMYKSPTQNSKCKCPRSCRIVINKPYVQNRQTYQDPYSLLYIYYASNLVTEMTEFIAYDWNIFLADLGGSLGFLLGLSVLGVIEVLHTIFKIIFRCNSKTKDEEKGDDEKNNPTGNGDYFNEEKFKEAEASKVENSWSSKNVNFMTNK